MKLSLGFSPCPNDTFIFDQMVNCPPKSIVWDLHLEDVETLNEWAMDGKLDITKLSFATYLKVKDTYDLLPSGAALGKGVGPIIVTKNPLILDSHEKISKFLNESTIGIPGLNTTANLLLTAAFPTIKNKQEILFSEIENAVLNNTIDAGLLIHESRFTYQDKGLHKLIDLGEWWEKEYQASIPLGGIVIKKNLSVELKDTVTQWIQNSLRNSWSHYPVLSPFVKENAQEMDESVMRSHINLYVNDETMELSNKGWEAIHILENAYLNVRQP